ncbi:MAG: hypothetical protein RIT81_09530 [Deltaproteobacteria bacterium]
MRLSAPSVRSLPTVLLLMAGACSGQLNCGGCFGGALTPVPGGFPPEAQIERAAQVRMTQSGFDQIGREFQDLMSAYASMSCGAPADVPCPTNFVTSTGTPNPASCQVGRCVEQVSGDAGPLLGFEIDRQVSGNATICRDDPAQPGARRCFAWIRFEALTVQPMGPNQFLANVTVQIETNDIPFRYDSLGGMDCVMSLSSVPGTQDIQITAALDRYMPPVGTGGQLKVEILDVAAMIPNSYVEVDADPDPRFTDGPLLCAIADLGFIKQLIVSQLTDELATIIGDEVDAALGRPCLTNADCPAQTSCNADDLCEEDATAEIVPQTLGIEGRLDFAQLLSGFVSGRPGRGDMSFMVGGDSTTDTAGANIGALGGAEVVDADPACAMILDSPRLRPGFVAPAPLPTSSMADLDWDGTDETGYMVAAGFSQALLDQFMWTVYTTGLMCTSVSSYDVDLLNTGSLGLLISSLRQLTHEDRFEKSIFPARLSIFPRAEPRILIGSGEVMPGMTEPTLTDPLLVLDLDDFEIGFSALIEERWVHLMTVTADVEIGLGAFVTANNELQFVVGDVSNAVTNVRVTNSDLLAEDPADLEDAIPGLINLALPGFTGALPPFALPGPADLGGFDLSILGVRGVEANGRYANVAVYADLAFDPSFVGNLSAAAETRAELTSLFVPSAQEFSVSNPGGPVWPEAEIALGGTAPGDGELEYQLRVDGGFWTPFFTTDRLKLIRPEFLAQGDHWVDVRAREVGAYRTLDPSPVRLSFTIDAEPPRLTAKMDYVRGGVVVRAWDVVSEDAVVVTLGVDGAFAEVTPDTTGFVPAPEVNDTAAIVVRAEDEAGHVSELVLREAGMVTAPARIEEATGCRCVNGRTGAWWALALLPLFVWRRRR